MADTTSIPVAAARAESRALRHARRIAMRAARWREPRTVWLAFAVLQVVTIGVLAGQMLAGDTIGDLPLYREWMIAATSGDGVVGITEPWVYPLLAWLPIGAAGLFGAPAYLTVWLAMIIALDAWVLRLLLGVGPSRTAARRATAADPRAGTVRSVLAGWAWMGMLLTLAPVSLLRLEGVTAPLVVIALVWLGRRPWIAGALLAVATWIKVWPAAVIGAALVASRDRSRILQAGVVVTLGVVVLAFSLGGAGYLASFVTMQGDRNLQLEAPLATPWVWMAMLGVPGAASFQNVLLATREVIGPGDELMLTISTPLMIVVTLTALVLAQIAVRRGAPRTETLLTAALAITTAMFVCNRVGSPQYMLWMVPIAVAALVVVDGAAQRWWRRMTAILLATSLATTIIFPVVYLQLVDLQAWAVLLLTVRNLALIAVLGAVGYRLVELALGASALRAAGLRRRGVLTIAERRSSPEA